MNSLVFIRKQMNKTRMFFNETQRHEDTKMFNDNHNDNPNPNLNPH